LSDVLLSLRGYRSEWLRGDLIAGRTVWAVLVPESLAYATVAGVSPVVGLYAAPAALVFFALFGSSRHLVTGPMSATAALSAAAVADLATGGPDNFAAFTSALAIVTGVIALVAGLLKLGFLANFISEPVLKGFIVGLALTIIVGQLPKLFGIEKESGNFFEQLGHFVRHLRRHPGRHARDRCDLAGTRPRPQAGRAGRSRIERELDDRGVTVWIAALPPRALATARLTARREELERDNRLFPTTLGAIHTYRSRE
jgi:hypothetical protein